MTIASSASDSAPSFDVVVIGSGAGGAAVAHPLVKAGLRVALVEKGGELPRDGSTLDFRKVVIAGAFKSQEEWLDGNGKRFRPDEYFNVGGKTRWYGAALLRYGAHEFLPEADHQCVGWPISAAELEPYYEQAEQMLGVRTFDCEPDLRALVERLERRSAGWRSQPLPLALSPAILANALEARHFDGFASVSQFKGDADSFLRQVRSAPNFTLFSPATVTDLLPSGQETLVVGGVRLADGQVLRGRSVVLAAGALHSPRLLQRYLETHGVAERLPAGGQVGRNLKMHLLTAMVAISPGAKTDLLRKTLLCLSDDLPHSSVQPLGFDAELISTLIPPWVPRWLARQVGTRAYGFFLQTEDGAHHDNCVRGASAATGNLPQLDYDARRTPAANAEHGRLVRKFRGALLRAGMIAFAERIGPSGTAHVSGTLCTGNDPSHSVVDANGCVHGMRGLYVADGSVLPRSSRVNPSLTIYAWGLRLGTFLAGKFEAEGG